MVDAAEAIGQDVDGYWAGIAVMLAGDPICATLWKLGEGAPKLLPDSGIIGADNVALCRYPGERRGPLVCRSAGVRLILLAMIVRVIVAPAVVAVLGLLAAVAFVDSQAVSEERRRCP